MFSGRKKALMPWFVLGSDSLEFDMEVTGMKVQVPAYDAWPRNALTQFGNESWNRLQLNKFKTSGTPSEISQINKAQLCHCPKTIVIYSSLHQTVLVSFDFSFFLFWRCCMSSWHSISLFDDNELTYEPIHLCFQLVYSVDCMYIHK